MDKIRLFEFITVVLPALLFALLLMLIFGIEFPDELDSGSLLFLIAALPVSLFLGHLLSHFGDKSEYYIGKVTKQKHPIVDILNNQFPEVRDDLKKMFPNTVTDNSKDGEMDSLFDKGRTLLYQQDYSERAESIAMQATFFRNIIPIALILFFCYWLSYLLGCNETINELWWLVHLWFTITVILILFTARFLSQKLYKAWFKEVLKNLEIYFKTKNINNNGSNT